MSEKKRSIFLDIARGVGIILVVIGHTMSPVMTGNAVMEAAYQILYVFHMPLFFFLAGLVAQNLIGGGGILLPELTLSSEARPAL
jgi:fucose 4-O-acetylase-like acetyltransferase